MGYATSWMSEHIINIIFFFFNKIFSCSRFGEVRISRFVALPFYFSLLCKYKYGRWPTAALASSPIFVESHNLVSYLFRDFITMWSHVVSYDTNNKQHCRGRAVHRLLYNLVVRNDMFTHFCWIQVTFWDLYFQCSLLELFPSNYIYIYIYWKSGIFNFFTFQNDQLPLWWSMM